MKDWIEKGIVLGVLAGTLWYYIKVEKPKERKRKRQEQMIADYPEIVFKLALLCGAGLPLPAGWNRIVGEYEKEKEKKGKRGTRYAYEEMVRTASQIQNGCSPGKAFGEFGRRIGIYMYIKLGNILEQNIRKGTKGLTLILQGEAYLALEERMHRIRRQGEETSTKLLIPMFLMFGVILVIILVPAFAGFSLS